jgi:hypothetical protein
MTYAVAFGNKPLPFREDLSRWRADHTLQEKFKRSLVMNTKLKVCIIGGALLAGLSATAAARDNVSFSLSFGVPAYTYVAPPPPVYYAPAPEYYYEPAPAVYYAPPPRVVYYGPNYRHRHGHGHRNHPRHW